MTLREYQRVAKNFNVIDKRMDSVDSILNTEKEYTSQLNQAAGNKVGTSFGETVLMTDSRDG